MAGKEHSKAMPAPLLVDWSEVKTLALAIGVREAARQMGLSEEAVKKRCTRDGWLQPVYQAQEAIHEAQSTVAEYRAKQGVPTVPTAAEVLSRLGPDSRSKVAIGLHKGAQHIAEMDGQEVLMAAQQVGQTVKSLALVHGWAQNHTISVLGEVVSGSVPDLPSDVIDV